MKIAIVVDDLAVDRQLAARNLRRSGWLVHLARNSVEGMALIQDILQTGEAHRTVVITDLDMPSDPAMRTGSRSAVAGANFALLLRTRMEQGQLARMPIVALTAISEREIHLTALAFGCDTVLQKPATPDLAERIEQALSKSHSESSEPVGGDALLQLLRSHLAKVGSLPEPAPLTSQDITKALLAYHRHGLPGLGDTQLARHLAPQAAGSLERGEKTYLILSQQLQIIMQLGVLDTLELLTGELIDVLSPAEQCAKLAISLSEYYRRRNEAIKVLFELLSKTFA